MTVINQVVLPNLWVSMSSWCIRAWWKLFSGASCVRLLLWFPFAQVNICYSLFFFFCFFKEQPFASSKNWDLFSRKFFWWPSWAPSTDCNLTHKTESHSKSCPLTELPVAYQVLNLSSRVTSPSPFTLHALFTALGCEGDKAKGGSLWCWIKGEGDTQNYQDCQGNGSGLARGGRTYGGAGGSRPGDGGDGSGPAEEAITEGNLPQWLSAGPRRWLHNRYRRVGNNSRSSR